MRSRINIFSILALLLLMISLTLGIEAQRVARWSDKADDHPHFIEGTFHLPVGGKDFRLVSLHDNFERFKVGKNEKLFFEFEAPGNEDFLLTVQERYPNAKYVLQSKPGKTKKTNRLGPWSVDRYLQHLNLSQRDLGVMLNYKEDNSPYYLPVSVHSEGEIRSSKKYVARVRINNSIKKSIYRVFKGELSGTISDQDPDHIGSIRKKSAGQVQIRIPKKKLKGYEGWVTVEVMFAMAKNNKMKPFRFYIYHASS